MALRPVQVVRSVQFARSIKVLTDRKKEFTVRTVRSVRIGI